MYVCMYMCMCICIYTYTYTYTHVFGTFVCAHSLCVLLRSVFSISKDLVSVRVSVLNRQGLHLRRGRVLVELLGVDVHAGRASARAAARRGGLEASHGGRCSARAFAKASNARMRQRLLRLNLHNRRANGAMRRNLRVGPCKRFQTRTCFIMKGWCVLPNQIFMPAQGYQNGKCTCHFDTCMMVSFGQNAYTLEAERPVIQH